MALLELSNISYVVNEKSIIRDVSLSVHEGEYLTVVGPSGSGKSTLVNEIMGKAMILFAKTVRRNILFPYDIRGMEPDMIRIKYLFDLLHMPIEYLERHNDELSGGEMQRICLIRSLIFEPKVLLLDEVTSALDAVNTAIVEQVIDELHNNGMTIIAITHSEEQSLRKANRRITIVDGSLAKEEVLR